ncbi:unnamed protein product [Rhizopus stolonifer]
MSGSYASETIPPFPTSFADHYSGIRFNDFCYANSQSAPTTEHRSLPIIVPNSGVSTREQFDAEFVATEFLLGSSLSPLISASPESSLLNYAITETKILSPVNASCSFSEKNIQCPIASNDSYQHPSLEMDNHLLPDQHPSPEIDNLSLADQYPFPEIANHSLASQHHSPDIYHHTIVDQHPSSDIAYDTPVNFDHQLASNKQLAIPSSSDSTVNSRHHCCCKSMDNSINHFPPESSTERYYCPIQKQGLSLISTYFMTENAPEEQRLQYAQMEFQLKKMDHDQRMQILKLEEMRLDIERENIRIRNNLT